MSLSLATPLTRSLTRGLVPAEGFDPNSIPNLILNLDSTVFSSFTFNGPKISQWADLSGNGNNLVQATASSQPLFVASSNLNGFPGVRFTGSPVFLRNTGALKDTKERTMFFVNNIVSTSGTGGAFYGYNNSGDFIHYGVGSLPHFHGSPTFPKLINADVRAFPTWFLSITFDTTLAVTWQNFVKKTTTVSSNPTSSASFYIGAEREAFDKRFFEGDMGQILIYDRVLTDPEVVTIQNALIPKWLIQ